MLHLKEIVNVYHCNNFPLTYIYIYTLLRYPMFLDIICLPSLPPRLRSSQSSQKLARSFVEKRKSFCIFDVGVLSHIPHTLSISLYFRILFLSGFR